MEKLYFLGFIFVLIMLEVKSINIVPRDEWGAKPPKHIEHIESSVPFAIIHHSYMPKACYSLKDCAIAMRSMQRFHQDDRGWNDIGYTFAIGGDGNIYEGRGFNVVGAHAPKFNDKSIGICMIGDWQVDLPPPLMLEAVQDLLSYAVSIEKLDGNYTLLGHRQVRATECPGERLFSEIKTWPHFSENVPEH